jgi:hypothetical protein
LADLRRINKAYLVLLPKKEGAISPKDYRPISLQNCIPKLCTKSMSLCLQPLIPLLVHWD